MIDSTTISLCLSQYRWADFRTTKGGVKLHLRLKFDEEPLPDKALVNEAKKSDRSQLDSLIVEDSDALNVFDRGYLDYERFDSYCQRGIRFVTRLKDNARGQILEEFDVEEDSVIEDDLVVRLGKGKTLMKNDVHLVITSDTKEKPVMILTNDFKLSADEISQIYRNRWQIELFFKWLKQHLKVKHFYGHSRTEVENQLQISLITYCLMQLLKRKTGFKGSLLHIKRLLKTCLFDSFEDSIRKLHGKSKTSKGRDDLIMKKSSRKPFYRSSQAN